MTRSTRDLSATSELLVELTVGTGQTDGQIDGPPREWSHNKTKKSSSVVAERPRSMLCVRQ